MPGTVLGARVTLLDLGWGGLKQGKGGEGSIQGKSLRGHQAEGRRAVWGQCWKQRAEQGRKVRDPKADRGGGLYPAQHLPGKAAGQG